MVRRTPAPIWLQTRVSFRLVAYLLALHAAALLAVLLAGVPPLATLAGGLLVVGSLLWQLRIHGWRRGSRAVRRLHWHADGSWLVADGHGQTARYAGCQPVLAEPGLILVRLLAPGRGRWLVLAGDSADPESLRQLRVRLRAQPGEGAGDQVLPLAGK